MGAAEGALTILGISTVNIAPPTLRNFPKQTVLGRVSSKLLFCHGQGFAYGGRDALSITPRPHCVGRGRFPGPSSRRHRQGQRLDAEGKEGRLETAVRRPPLRRVA